MPRSGVKWGRGRIPVVETRDGAFDRMGRRPAASWGRPACTQNRLARLFILLHVHSDFFSTNIYKIKLKLTLKFKLERKLRERTEMRNVKHKKRTKMNINILIYRCGVKWWDCAVLVWYGRIGHWNIGNVGHIYHRPFLYIALCISNIIVCDRTSARYTSLGILD